MNAADERGEDVVEGLNDDDGKVGDHFVYQYLDGAGRTVYVGYGASPARAMAHSGGSHNDALRLWLEDNRADVRIVGPYRDREEGLNVEAALISAYHPRFNVHPGSGRRFRPLGVPDELADRRVAPPISEAEIGIFTGGALLVFITPSKEMKDDRPKYDPTKPDDDVIALDVEGWWQIDRYVEVWRANPEMGPKVIVGVYGQPRHRFILGALVIDKERWGDDPENNRKGALWKVPLADRSAVDASELRGRRVSNVRFGRARWEHYRWVDALGTVRHPGVKVY